VGSDTLEAPMGRLRQAVTGSLLALSLFAVSCQGADTVEGRSRSAPRLGEQAPAFTLPSTEGGEVSLQEFQGRSPVLLYFSMGPG
jgi:hypothetical protein